LYECKGAEQKTCRYIPLHQDNAVCNKDYLQKLLKTSLDNSSGCIMSWADIWGLSQEKRYGGPDAHGYAAANNVPNGTAGTLRACAGWA
jgi:hypothetical protein